MSFCWEHPLLVGIEVAWRWLVGVPFLLVSLAQAQFIMVRITPAEAGLDRVALQNPWLTSVVLADAFGKYQPAVTDVLHWLAPLGILAWAVASGFGRMLIFWRMARLDVEAAPPRLFGKLPGLIALQGLWISGLAGCFWLWYSMVGWAAEQYITAQSQPDLVGYLCWLIFISLGIFVLWALLSWTLGLAPVLLVFERRSVLSALFKTPRLGKDLSGKLMEVNLVMSIVKIALIVLGMVFSAAPLPFSDEFAPGFMRGLYVLIAVLFLIGNDFFQLVRLRSFLSLWRVYRGTVALPEK